VSTWSPGTLARDPNQTRLAGFNVKVFWRPGMRFSMYELAPTNRDVFVRAEHTDLGIQRRGPQQFDLKYE
jgi:hypothetical protein